MATDKSPAFQFYPTDFLSSSKVARMSLTEIGIYTVLLCHAWLDDGLPVSLPAMAKLVRLPAGRFAKLWSGVLSECFREEGGRFVNIRLERERDKQASRRSSSALNGALGGRPKNNLGVISTKAKGEGDGNEDGDRFLEEERRTSDFEAFWRAYPRKDGKQAARVEWQRLQLDAVAIQALWADLARRCQSLQWLKDGGQFIPHARTYLHQRRWEDGFVEIPAVNEKTARTLTSGAAFVAGGLK